MQLNLFLRQFVDTRSYLILKTHFFNDNRRIRNLIMSVRHVCGCEFLLADYRNFGLDKKPTCTKERAYQRKICLLNVLLNYMVVSVY